MLIEKLNWWFVQTTTIAETIKINISILNKYFLGSVIITPIILYISKVSGIRWCILFKLCIFKTLIKLL